MREQTLSLLSNRYNDNPFIYFSIAELKVPIFSLCTFIWAEAGDNKEWRSYPVVTLVMHLLICSVSVQRW